MDEQPQPVPHSVPGVPATSPDVDGASQDLPSPLRIPGLDAAIAEKSASFTQVAEANFGTNPKFVPVKERREAYQERVAPVLEAFRAAHGVVEKAFYCQNIVAAVAFTCRKRRERYLPFRRSEEIVLHHVNNEFHASDLQILEALDGCERLAIDARAHLKGRDKRVCIQQIYAVESNLLNLLDSRVASREAGAAEPSDGLLIDLKRRELVEAREFYRASAQRDAQVRYFVGMVAGVLVVGVLALLCSGASLPGSDLNFLASFVAGAVGAVVSVLSRMASDSFVLTFESGAWQIRILGFFRPFVGAIFGLVLYFVLAAEVLPIEVPTDPDQAFFFVSVVAFLSGFFERWAQDMLVVTRNTLTPSRTTPRADDERQSDANPSPP